MKKRMLKKQQIMKMSIGVMFKQGYHGTGIKDLTDAAALSSWVRSMEGLAKLKAALTAPQRPATAPKGKGTSKVPPPKVSPSAAREALAAVRGDG